MSDYSRKVQEASERWEQAEAEVSPENWRAATEHARSAAVVPEDCRTEATAALVGALLGLIIWPAGAVAVFLAWPTLPRRGRPRPYGSKRGRLAFILGAAELALTTAVIVLHFLHPLTTI